MYNEYEYAPKGVNNPEYWKGQQIKADTDELDKLATKYKDLGSQATDLLSKLNSIVGCIDANWNGRAADAFNGKYNNWKNTITGYAENLNNAASELTKVSSNLKAADQSNY